ncbi:craniofacial development protein 2-like [Saccostrea cucullata]|uniref:craniofacial development protein 2-like n=1 Tax=Saccostrea cuccullata TaxID=36930 RepID=UPI002ED27D97
MYEQSKTAQVADEMQRYKLDILGISECRWIKSGKIRITSGHTILYSRHNDKHQSGIAIMISKDKIKTLLEWEPISDRLIRARLNSKYCKLTIIQCYAPTNDAEEEVKDEFYEKLQMVVSNVPQHDMLLIMGDLNAKVGTDNTDCEIFMVKHGCGIKNGNGERFIDFCLNNNQMIGGTIFPHKDIQKLTWKSPDGRTTNQIDHITVNSKWRKSLQDVRVCHGADVNSDHYLLKAIIKLKLRRNPKKQETKRKIDVEKLKIPDTRKSFNLKLKNRFCKKVLLLLKIFKKGGTRSRKCILKPPKKL